MNTKVVNNEKLISNVPSDAINLSDEELQVRFASLVSAIKSYQDTTKNIDTKDVVVVLSTKNRTYDDVRDELDVHVSISATVDEDTKTKSDLIFKSTGWTRIETPKPNEPEPLPNPDPVKPEPKPDPTPNPYPVKPEPLPNPDPVEPEPKPDPVPTPSPVEPEPEPAPTPAPVEPEPVTNPDPVEPEPKPDPAPSPAPSPANPTPDPTPNVPAPETPVSTSSTNLLEHSGYIINREVETGLPDENNYQYVVNNSSTFQPTKLVSNQWTAQNGAMTGTLNQEDFLSADSSANSPEFNPNNNTFNLAVKQRDEIIKINPLNPNAGNKTTTYNFWYNWKIIAKRDYIQTGESNVDNISPTPQPLVPSVNLKSTAAEMKDSELKLNLESLKYLVLNNEMGQNPKMLAWKLITLSDEIRFNKKSVVSDHLEPKNNGCRKSKFLFESIPSGVSEILFYADEISNENGSLNLYVAYKINGVQKAFKITLNRDNVDLKRNSDYIQYINDRSISLGWDYRGYFDENDNRDDEINQTWLNMYTTIHNNFISFKSKSLADQQYILRSQGLKSKYFGRAALQISQPALVSGGTMWIVDKIVDDNQPAGTHSFLMATNKHVLDMGQMIGTEIDGYFKTPGNVTTNIFYQVSLDEYLKSNELFKMYPNINADNYQEILINDTEIVQVESKTQRKLTRLDVANDRAAYIKSTAEKSEKLLNKQASWLANSGFAYLRWNRFNGDIETSNQIPSSDIKNGGDPNKPSPAQASTYKYKNQIIGNFDQGHDFVGFDPYPLTFINNDYSELLVKKDGPTELINSRKNLVDNIVYVPQHTTGHITRNNGEQSQSNITYRLREEEANNYTNKMMGQDLVFVKMTLRDSEIERDWPALWKALNLPEEEQAKWFGGTIDATPRTDDRTTTYLAGYPAANYSNGSQLIFSWRVSDTSITYSTRTIYSDVGTGSILQKFVENWDADKWNNLYAPIAKGGSLAPYQFENFPWDTIISNEKNGLYTETVLAATTSVLSGDHVNPGNSGSMVVDANFSNYGIVYAFGPTGYGDRTFVHNFVQQDPYSVSNVLTDDDGHGDRANIRYELEKILKNKGIVTLNLNPKND